MGTPHGGSPHAGWASTLARWLNRFRSTNEDLLRTLRSESETLQQVEEDFQRVLRTAHRPPRIHCFYEAFSVTVTGKIVEDSSARLPGYSNYSIQANHMGMTKFRSHSDEGYQLVIGVLRRWTDAFTNDAQAADQGEAQQTPREPERVEQARQELTTFAPVFNNTGISSRNTVQGQNSGGGAITLHFG